MDYLILQPFLISAGIGALIGAERERERISRMNFGGFRTFVFIALLGTLSATLMVAFRNPWFMLVTFIALVALTIATYFYMASKDSPGIITELLVFITYILGALVYFEDYKIFALILAVCIVVLAESGRYIHKFIQETSEAEWVDTLRFASVALVLYPLLPNEFIDPWNLINPSKIWFLVILISGLEFLGYFLMKIIKSKKAIVLNGFLGGLVSSTATTSSMTNRSKITPSLSNEYAQATIVSSLTMFVRVLMIIGVISLDLLFAVLPYILLPIAGMMLVGLFITFEKSNDQDADHNGFSKELGSPFNFGPAIKMALLFTAVKIIAQLSMVFIGNSGIILTSAVSGLVDVDAITLSISDMFVHNTLLASIAVQAIILASVVNTVSKGLIAFTQGSKEFATKIALSFGASAILGFVSIGLLMM